MNVECDAAMLIESTLTPQIASSQSTTESTGLLDSDALADKPRPVEPIPSNTLKPPGQTKSISDEFMELKKNLKKVVMSLERLGCSMKEGQLISSEVSTVEALKQSVTDVSGTSKVRSKYYRGRYSPKYFVPRKPAWTLKVLDPHGLDLVESLEQIEMKEATIKSLKADGITEAGYLEKNILARLIIGDDFVLQIRGNKLESYSIYPIIDVLSDANPEVQILVLMNRMDAQSSRSFIASVQNYINVTGLDVALQVVPRDPKFDLGRIKDSTSIKPSVFVTTPELMTRLKAESIINPKSVNVLVVYEAEYVFRTSNNVEAIRSFLDETHVCQVVLAAHDGTEDLVNAIESFDFPEETAVFSMDRVNIQSAIHYNYTDATLTESFIERAVKLSKEGIVIVICHDAIESNKLKGRLADSAEILTIAGITESKGSASGLLIIPQLSSGIIQTRDHSTVKLILNISGSALTPDRYLEIMASYMDIGKECEVITWIRSHNGLWYKGFEELGVTFRENLPDQLETFRVNLENFARQHRKDIQKDPVFRMHFQKMCANIGVDPLASSKGVWGELLGVSDFYYELGIQIIDVCLSTRALNGGLMELSEVKRRVERMRGKRDIKAPSSTSSNAHSNSLSSKLANMSSKDTNIEITEDDVFRSIKTLAPLGSGFQVLQIGDKKMVSSVPRELNRDQSAILALVRNTRGHVNSGIIYEQLGWESGRINTALDTLLEDSLMWIDKQAEPYEYWVPGFFEPEDDDIYAATESSS
ncbi:ESCRT-II subunit protein snf8 [Haplosporangium sp. Z 27]|nr:ESCRT-II subunit protein snf8 [Haplosporangium sp. Z 27]